MMAPNLYLLVFCKQVSALIISAIRSQSSWVKFLKDLPFGINFLICLCFCSMVPFCDEVYGLVEN